MKPVSFQRRRPEQGSALVVVMILMLVMAASLAAVHSYTTAITRQTGNNTEVLRANAAAEAAIEAVAGRLMQWVTANSGYGPSIHDCATAGVPGNASFPAITSAVTFPSDSKLNDYTVSTPLVYPVLPDDTIITSTSDPKYLPDIATRINVSDNSLSSVARYYTTRSMTLNARNIPSRSTTYKITVTVTPKLTTLKSAPALTLTRFLRCDKISPFSWCTYRNGTVGYANTNTYNGPLYVAINVWLGAPTTFTDSILYGGTATNAGANFTGGGYTAQVKQTSLLSLIPNLTGNMAVNSSGTRLASYEANTTIGGAANSSTSAPSDDFSSRELIEVPTNPANDTSPPVIKNSRIYNQADVRIQVTVTKPGSTKVVTKNVVNVDGSIVSASSNPWVTPLLAAVNVNTTAAGTSGAFIDRSRSTSTSVQSTDVNVGALATVMNANPSVFPTGVVYIWDSSTSSVAPLQGVRVWNAGVLPNTGLVVGTDEPIYMKGDFNTGATLPNGATINTPPNVLPYSSNGMAVNNNTTTEAQRTVSGYTIKPAGLFGDSMTELSNAWTDTNSANTTQASNTTYNLVEGWTTMSANELRSDDTYLDAASRANPLWLENWANTRRTMSGEEFCVWHSKYGTSTNEFFNGGWSGDISFDAKATALPLNWGTVNFVRDRASRL
jgi:Tfp pilus assembly protein PilX